MLVTNIYRDILQFKIKSKIISKYKNNFEYIHSIPPKIIEISKRRVVY
jgi:hypothetical protein